MLFKGILLYDIPYSFSQFYSVYSFKQVKLLRQSLELPLLVEVREVDIVVSQPPPLWKPIFAKLNAIIDLLFVLEVFKPLWELTDEQLLAYFNSRYPQRQWWQLRHLRSKVHSALISSLRRERVPPEGIFARTIAQ